MYNGASTPISASARSNDATAAIAQAQQRIGLPSTIFGSYAGAAALFQQSQSSQLWLIAIAVAVIYVILGMLYESWIHPVTILLGVPSAAVGALLALRLANMELSFIAMIGILLPQWPTAWVWTYRHRCRWLPMRRVQPTRRRRHCR